MKQREFLILIAADAVESVELFRDDASGGVWSMHVDLAIGHPIPGAARVVVDARGTAKSFRSLDTACAWAKSLGWSGTVLVRDLQGS